MRERLAMTTSFLSAFLLVCVGGVLTGVFTGPMKYLTRWRWENVWLVYALFAQLIIPWAVIGAVIPHLLSLYEQVPLPRLILVLLLGTLWGIGSVTFGIGVDRLGAGLGFALIMCISTLLGTVLPLFLSRPSSLKALPFVLGLVLLMSGVALSGFAGMRRERGALSKERHFATGLAICIASGILSSFFNIGMVVAKPIQNLAITRGAPAWASGDAVWPILLCGCFLSNACYCGYLLTKNGSGRLFFQTGGWEWCGAFGMGAAWIIGVLAYGAGALSMGQLGPVLGFPVFTALMLVCAYGVGRISGEWRGVDRTTVRWMNTAVMLNVISVFVIGYSR